VTSLSCPDPQGQEFMLFWVQSISPSSCSWAFTTAWHILTEAEVGSVPLWVNGHKQKSEEWGLWKKGLIKTQEGDMSNLQSNLHWSAGNYTVMRCLFPNFVRMLSWGKSQLYQYLLKTMKPCISSINDEPHWVPVAHACNPSYLGGSATWSQSRQIVQEILSWKYPSQKKG
jgi:hypothetical protein